MDIRSARTSERSEVLDLLALWYNDREFFARYNESDPTFRDEFCLVAVDRGRIVSTVQIFDRAINLHGERVPMGGIGSVFTREDYRHKGLASELMKLAVETMTRAGFEVSLLFAERISFYNQFGWREVKRNFSIIPQARSLRVPTDIELDIFDPHHDLEAVARVHRSYSGRFNVTAVRDDAGWSGSLAFAGNQTLPAESSEEYFLVCHRNHEIAAYARATRFHGVAMLMEYGYLPDAEAHLMALFRHCSEMASGIDSSFPLKGDHSGAALLKAERPDAPAGLLISHTAHDRALESRFAAAGCPPMHHADNFYLWRILNADALAHRFGGSPDEASSRAFEIFKSDDSLFWTSDRF